MYSRIRNLREDKDMTQTEIAKILNCSQRIYSNYERGEVDIPTAILIKLAKFHNVSTDYLLGLTDDPKSNYKK
jgi:transcriptional regulator with XRE-family HTH domain